MEARFGPWARLARLEGTQFRIEPLSNARDTLTQLAASDACSGGWIYPPTERPAFDTRANAPLIPVRAYTLPATHRCECTDGLADAAELDFAIALIGVLDGIRITREGWTHFLKAPIELRKLGDLFCTALEVAGAVELSLATWRRVPSAIQQRLFGAIHWFTFGQLFEYDFERFTAHYTALDTLYWVCKMNTGLRAPHAGRSKALAEHYGMPVPPWAEMVGRSCPLADLRNELIHEARYAGAPIGFAYPADGITLELEAFVQRLILAALGVKSAYVKSVVSTRQIHGLDLELPPAAATAQSILNH